MASGGQVSNEDRPLFCQDWTAKQEHKLLESIDEFGYGNWSTIAVRVGKRPEECKQHYHHYYLFHPHPVLPAFPLNPPKVETKAESTLSKKLPLSNSDEPVEAYYSGTEISGFMPHRGDFATESDNGAEKMLSSISHEVEDDELTTTLKLAAIQIYTKKLEKRVFRKRVVREYGLLDIRRQTAFDRSVLTKRQLRMKLSLRPFMRFMRPDTAEKFLQSHYLEEQICQEIFKLQHYQQIGITTFRGAKLYEKLQVQRRQQASMQKDLMRKKCSNEENILYQALSQSTIKPKRPVKEIKLLDITYAAGVEKLDKEEKELCSFCRFQPEAYLHLKKLLIQEHKRLGKLCLADARKLLKIDVNKTRKIYDLLMTKSLISANSSS